MARRKHIDDLLREWPFQPDAVLVRTTSGADGRPVLQMRVDLGILQLEMEGRPDGEQPHAYPTYYDYIREEAKKLAAEFLLDEDQCAEIDREFLQFYQRRICWLQLRKFDLAVRDANHTLALMDFCKKYSPDDQWTMAHEQYRPFVMFHRTQASALAVLEEDENPEMALQAINRGLDQLKDVFREYDAEEQFDEDELVSRLVELREELRKRFSLGKTLDEKLAEAVAAEQYELAAKLRDELARRTGDEI